MEKDLVCSFTGHRIINSEHLNIIDTVIMRAIEYAYKQGCRTFISGGAIGFDTLAARQVILFRMIHSDVRLVMLLPCKNQDEKWNVRQKDTYSYIISVANEVEYISDEYTEDCMKKRNAALAERADMLVSYFSRRASGSWQTVRMAEKLGKTVYNIYNHKDLTERK